MSTQSIDTALASADRYRYNEASDEVHKLTTTWGQLPSIPADADERPTPVQLRADISHYLTRAVDSRSFAHAEAMRMSENVNRHYTRAKTILSKLQTMLENYPTLEEQQKSPVAMSKSPQLTRASKPSIRGANGEKVRQPMVPRITVPGEVLAPYDQFQPYSSGSESSSSSEDEEEDVRHRTPGRATPAPRIKVVKPPKTPKPPKPARTPKSTAPRPTPAVPAVPLVEPPPNAVIGSTDAPWLQLTPWEMARLRKRMKKNATWTPSDTMISRELNDLGRGIDAYRAAKKKAEDEGRQFDPALPALAADTGNMKTPEGALSAAAIKSDEVQLSNRGMKLNEAKKLKRESMAKQAAEEAEESARRFNETARRLMGPQQSQQSPQSPQTQSPTASKSKSAKANGNGNGNGSTKAAANGKRKRDSVTEAEAPKENGTAPVAQPPPKRTKTETPVPLPHMRASLSAQPLTETPVLPPVITPGGTVVAHSNTPVPVPVPGHDPAKRTVSPALSKENTTTTVTTTVPVKPPAETPIPPPILSPKKSTTPIFPPIREQPRRETRGDAAKKVQQDAEQVQQTPAIQTPAPLPPHRSSSAAPSEGPRTRSSTPADSLKNGRPGSRGKAASQEPQPSAVADRPRRPSTARNTPGPPSAAQLQQQQQQQRGSAEKRPPRRPAPGVVSTTTSGGSSAVGRRKKKPSVKKSQKKDVEELEEVDDEGNPIDPEEQRYCVCNGVSYGTMISCDNAVRPPSLSFVFWGIDC